MTYHLPLDPQLRRRNLRTALVLASVAAAFFIGILARYGLFDGLFS